MTTPWRKVLRDFWHERTRTILVIAAIALGIAAFSAVLSSYAILDRELNQGYLATNPASATLRTDAIDDDLLKVAASTPGVAQAEARRVVSGRIKAGPARWRPLMLFVVKDYADLRVSTLSPEGGAWPPGKGDILIERDAFQVARTRIGDSVTVRMPRGQDQTLRVTGGVHDVGQAQARMEGIVYGYATVETLALLGEEPTLDQLKILVAGDRFDRGHIAAVAADLKARLESLGHTVRRVDVPEPGKHPHADLMGMLLLAISSFGLLILGLSGVLVVNLLTALMASQIRQIGMMKAIGGTRAQIARIYLGQALLLGGSAVIVALPMGMLGARALCRYLAVFLNFDLLSFAVPAWVYLLVAFVGLLTPLLAAAWPVAKGSAVTVTAALSDFGVADRGFGADWLDRALAGVSGLTRPLLLAIRNSFRHRTRLGLTLLTLSVSGVFFMSALNVRASMISTIDHLFGAKRFDVSVTLAEMYPIEKIQRALLAAPGVSRHEAWIATDAFLATASAKSESAGPSTGLHESGGGHGGETPPPEARFGVLGLQEGTTLLKLEIDEGRDLEPGETDAIVVNSSFLSRHPEVRVGQSISLRMGPKQSDWRVVGVSHEAFGPPTGYVWRTWFENAGAHAGMSNTIRVALDRSDAASIDGFREALDRSFEAEGLRALSTTSKADSRVGFDEHMLMIYLFLVVMSVIIGGVGGLGLMTTMSLNVLERRREMGVLRAIGASTRTVWLIVVAESLAIGLMSFMVASIVAGPLSRGLGDFIGDALFQTGLSFVFDPAGLVIGLAASLVLSAIASFLPAWHASRSPVREALGFE